MNALSTKYAALLILIFIFLSPIYGDSVAAPCSYSVDLAASNTIFVMLSPDPTMECSSFRGEKLEAAKSLRAKYPSSGLYGRDSLTPIWTVDWFAYQVKITTDSKYLVRIGPWASKESDEAFSFFVDGKLLKRYAVSDVVRYTSALPHSVSHFEWEKSLKLNELERTFVVSTLEGGEFTFDLATGEIVHQSLPIFPSTEGLNDPRFYFSNLPTMIIALLFGGIILYFGVRKIIRIRRLEKGR